jgi:hypothetical protein
VLADWPQGTVRITCCSFHFSDVLLSGANEYAAVTVVVTDAVGGAGWVWRSLAEAIGAGLAARRGRGFSERNLRQIRLFYLDWPIPHINGFDAVSVGLPDRAE